MALTERHQLALEPTLELVAIPLRPIAQPPLVLDLVVALARELGGGRLLGLAKLGLVAEPKRLDVARVAVQEVRQDLVLDRILGGLHGTRARQFAPHHRELLI